MIRNSRFLFLIAIVLALGLASTFTQPSVQTAQAVTPIPPPDLTLTKSHSGFFVVGQAGTYTMTVNNIGSGSTSGGTVTVVEHVPVNVQYTGFTAGSNAFACTPAAPVSGPANITCSSIAPIANGSNATFTITVNPGAGAAGSPVGYTNTADVSFTPSGVNPAESNTANNHATDPTEVLTAPDISIFKTASDGPYVQGQQATYTIKVQNNGTQPTTNPVSVTDTVPSGFESIASLGSAGWTCPTSTTTNFSCHYDTGFTGNAPFITVTVNLLASGSTSNTANVTGGGGTITKASDTSSFTIVGAPDLAITKAVNGATPYIVNKNNTFTLQVNNVSSAATSGTTTVTDTLDVAHLNYVSATSTDSSTCSFASPTVTCSQPNSIAASGSYTITITVNPKAVGTNLSNTGSVSTPFDTSSSNNSSSVNFDVLNIDLGIAKSHSDPVGLGVASPFSITVNNHGTFHTQGTITITDKIPSGWRYLASGSGGSGFTCPGSDITGSGTAGAPAATITCTSSSAIAPGDGNAVTFPIMLVADQSVNFTNVATVNVANDNDASNNSASDPVTVATANLSLTKTHGGVFTLSSNGTGTFTLRATNSGAPNGAPIIFTDVLPFGLSFNAVTGKSPSAGWAGTGCITSPDPSDNTLNDVICEYDGQLTNGAGNFISVTFSVNITDSAASQVVNNASVTTTGMSQPATATDTVNISAAPIADLTITKTHTPEPFVVGVTPQKFTVVVKNSGTAALPSGTPITITDPLPSGFTLDIPNSDTITCTGTTSATCTYTTASSTAVNGTVVTGHIAVSIDSSAIGPFSNTATVTCSVAGCQATNNTGTDTGHVVAAPAPSISVTKTHTGSFTVNNPGGTWQITLTNNGSVAAATGAIVVTDTLPSGVESYASSSVDSAGVFPATPCSATGTGFTCTNSDGALGPGNSRTITVQVNVTGSVPRTDTNNVSVVTSGGNPTTTSASDSALVTATGPDVKIVKSHTGNFTINQNGQFNLAVSNIGSGPTTSSVVVTDTLPSGLTYVSASGGTFSCSASSQTVTCTQTDPINNGSTVNITLTVTPTATGSKQNTANVSDAGDINPGGGEKHSTDTVLVNGVPDLTVGKTHPGNFFVGQTNAIYTVTITNNGSGATSGTITASDTLPSGLTFNSVQTGPFVCTGAGNQSFSCTTNTVLQTTNGSNTTTFSYKVNVVSAGGGTNSVSVTGGGFTGPATANDPTTVDVAATPFITLTKAGPSNFNVGQAASYSIAVKNTGSGPSTTPMTVSDTLPTGFTLNSSSGTNGFTCSGSSTVTCTTNTVLNSGSTATITLNVTATNSAGNSASNFATETGGSASDATSNTVTSTVTDNPNITLTKTQGSGSYLQNSNGTFNLDVSNDVNAGSTTSTTSVVDTLPSGTSYQGFSNILGSWNCSASGQTVTCTTSDIIAAGTHKTVSITVRPTLQGSYTNSATASTSGSSNSTSSVTFFVNPPDQTQISGSNSTISPSSVTVGLNTTTTITVTVRNGFNNAIVGATVNLSPNTISSGSVTQSNSTTDSNGNIVFTVQSSINQTLTFTATASFNGTTVNVSGSSVVTFGSGSSGSGSASSGTLTTNFTSIPADNIATVTITAHVQNSGGTGLSGKTVQLTGSPTLSGLSPTLPTSLTTDGSGNAAFVFRSTTQGGPVTFTGTDTTDSIGIGTVSVTFTAPGTAAVASTSTATATPTGTAGLTTAQLALLASSATGNVGIVVPWRLCVRSGPGTSFPALGVLKGKTPVSILARNALGTAQNFPPRLDCQGGRGGATWLLIQLGAGQTGWVSAYYIRVRSSLYRHLPFVDPTTNTTVSK